MTAVVEGNHAPAFQGREPAGMHPVDLLGRGKAVNKDDRLAFALVEICDLDGTVMKARHDIGMYSQRAAADVSPTTPPLPRPAARAGACRAGSSARSRARPSS